MRALVAQWATSRGSTWFSAEGMEYGGSEARVKAGGWDLGSVGTSAQTVILLAKQTREAAPSFFLAFSSNCSPYDQQDE